MSTEERHSFLIGLFEVLCPWPARYKITKHSEYKPFKQHHYYLAGRAAGMPILTLEIVALTYLLTHLP